MRLRSLAATLLLAAARMPAAANPTPEKSLAVLYRTDVAQAASRLRWKGPQLSDDTLLAVAASGLSWQPAWQAVPLLRRASKSVAYADAAARKSAFEAARAAGDDRLAAPYALSLVLDPPDSDSAAWRSAFEYLGGFGDDFDSVLTGIEQAPEKLPLLPNYYYAAADALVWRASPRLLPYLLTMASSSDRYLRSRGIAGLGVAAYESGSHRSDLAGFEVPLRSGSVSAAQRGMVDEALHQAAEDKNYRVRAAAAVALALAGDESAIPALQKLAKDPAYLALPAGDKNARRIVYPVRIEAVRALARFGRTLAEPPGGVCSGKALKQATRGGHDVTKDTSDIQKDQVSRVRFGDGIW